MGGSLLGSEVRRSCPGLLRHLLDLHQGAAIEKEDVLGIEGCETLDRSELHGVGAGGDGLEAGAIEVVEMIVGGDPYAAGSVECKREDEGLLNAIGGGEAVELRAIVSEETVFGGDPEETLFVLDHLEDIKVAEAFALTIVMEGELLSASAGGDEESEQEREQQPLEGQCSRCSVSTSLGPSGTAQRGPRGVAL